MQPTLALLALLAQPQGDLTLRVTTADLPAPDGVVVVKKLHAALDRAAAHLASCGACTVTVQVAGGTQAGKGQVGSWTFPETTAPRARLHLLGGYDAAFASRAPFAHPSVLQVSDRRSGPVLAFQGRKLALAELVVSGFAIDVSPGNRYDAQSGALHKGASSSWPVISFGALTTRRLVVSDNVFLNAAHGVASPQITPAGDDAEVIVRNNFFLGNVYCWQIAGLPTNRVVASYRVEGNTFFGNHPYNPDPNTSNPGALQIGNNYAAREVVIRGNLFASNPGGAIFPQWDEERGPPITIADNLFFENAALWDASEPGEGAVVGKFNGSAVHGVYSAAEIADDFSWKTEGNVVLDPGLSAPSKAEARADGEAAGESGDDDGDGTEVVRNAHIERFARRVALDVGALPLPREARAQRYGASPARVAQR